MLTSKKKPVFLFSKTLLYFWGNGDNVGIFPAGWIVVGLLLPDLKIGQ
jgi:hypothetical protein